MMTDGCEYRWAMVEPNAAEDVASGARHVCGLEEGHAGDHCCPHDGAMAANVDECCYCGTGDGLRPYGPGGAAVCFPCATATPEREATTRAAFEAIVRAATAASPVGGVVVSRGGISPFVPDGDTAGVVWLPVDVEGDGS